MCAGQGDVLARGPRRCVGADRVEAVWARARERRATLVQADARALPFRDSAFSGALPHRTLQHVEDTSVALQSESLG